MKTFSFLTILGCAVTALSDEPLPFKDDMRGPLREGWSWIREDADSWRTTQDGLEIRVLPGNMWGAKNDAKNVLLRPVPDSRGKKFQVSIYVENQPTEQYEQVDLVWYYADSHMVKIGQELVNGQLSIVMGREENDRTRTIAIIPVKTHRVGLRFRIDAKRIQGFYLPAGTDEWKNAGACDLPSMRDAAPQISIQAYQGPKDKFHWARIRDLEVRHLPVTAPE